MTLSDSWLRWLEALLVMSAGAAAAFVACTYLFALALTRGSFGWPGLSYFWREALWVLVTQSLLPFGWLGSGNPSRAIAARPNAPGNGRPIVLCHGYVQNRSNFVWLARALARRGHGPFFGFNYHSLRPVESSARSLGAFVEHVIQETGATEVDVICHSLGGVVARTYADLQGGDRYVRRIVTLGSPHRGLLQANRVFGASIHDLHPRTGFIERLEAARSSVQMHSIYSSHDNIVFPGSASALGERGTDVVVSQHGHFGILFSTEVAEHVHRALSTPVGER